MYIVNNWLTISYVFKGERPVDDIKFTDDNVCKSYLMGLCPHELFNNTVSEQHTHVHSCQGRASRLIKQFVYFCLTLFLLEALP